MQSEGEWEREKKRERNKIGGWFKQVLNNKSIKLNILKLREPIHESFILPFSSSSSSSPFSSSPSSYSLKFIEELLLINLFIYSLNSFSLSIALSLPLSLHHHLDHIFHLFLASAIILWQRRPPFCNVYLAIFKLKHNHRYPSSPNGTFGCHLTLNSPLTFTYPRLQ